MRTCTNGSSRRLCLLLALLLLAAAFLSLCVGSSGTGLLSALGNPDSPARRILVHIRLPRVAGAMLAGAALACSGAILQGVLQNPLAGPSVIGVNAGAALGTLALGIAAPMAAAWLPLAAFAGALAPALLVLALTRRTGASGRTVVLAGVAVSAILSAGSDLLITLFPDSVLGLSAFRVGGLAGIGASRVRVAACYILPALALSFYLARDLDVLTLGDELAASVGLRVGRARMLLLLLSALLAGAAVSFSGLIGFVGLIAPHMLRLRVGSRHQKLLPLCALGGALMLLCADTLSRVLFAPYELPVGILLSLAGGPFFLWLLLHGGKGYD